MTSSMISGERRWGSARRGGMTVLGKVAVPKPINLPSQRLENHGLDPNVEIVPKGTLSWGSRPSSAGSNAWGTSALSPSPDGGSSSPSHLAGRPTSGGGTRPSTAGSDRPQDNVNAWGPNSRPSSASGVLGSNHASLTSVRPRSADTRPGSSHLSRFAESSTESSGALGAAASERPGRLSPGSEGFSLSRGDFPTLGAEKDETRSDTEPLVGSHGRPVSSSCQVKSTSDSPGMAHAEEVARNADIRGNSWRRDGPPFVEDGPRPSMDRWPGDLLYQNPNMGPPHFESWHGTPPVNPQGGVWYRGPPGPPLYGGAVPPGSFPMEPFPYYRPQVPVPGLTNSQPIPPPGAGHHARHPKNGDMYGPHGPESHARHPNNGDMYRPHGPESHARHPNNGDMYRPHGPESYMRPGMHMRPGFYPGPVPYDGYYRPPMGFCNPNEQDMPFMGMGAPPPLYNRPLNRNAPDISSHPGSREGRGPNHVDSSHLHDPRGNYKVLVKPNDGWNQNDEDRWGNRVNTVRPNQERGILPNASLQESAWGDSYQKDEDVSHDECASAGVVSSKSFESKSMPSSSAKHMFHGNVRTAGENNMSPPFENVVSPKDHSLIQKIEGLNAKARASDERQDAFHREEPSDRSQNVHVKAHQSTNEAKSGVALERHPTGVLIPVSPGKDVSNERSQETIVTNNPRRVGRVLSRGNPHRKGRVDGPETDSWEKKSETHSALSGSSAIATSDQTENRNVLLQPAEAMTANVERKADGEFAQSGFDPSDTQRAKMKEIAKQRAIQLQKEEAQRIKEQKAKALAKLEELNKRSANQGVEVASQKDSVAPHSSVPRQQDDSREQPDPSVDAQLNTGTNSLSSKNIAFDERTTGKIVDSAVTSRYIGAEAKRSANLVSVSSPNLLPTADEAAVNRSVPQVNNVSKQKRVAHKQRQNSHPEKNFSQNSISAGKSEMLKDHKVSNANQEVTVDSIEVASGAVKEAESPVIFDAQAPHKRRNNKSAKNKQTEDSSTAVSSTVSMPKDSNLARTMPESAKQNFPDVHVNSTLVQLPAVAKESIKSSEDSSVSPEDAQGRVNTAWKAQHPRRSQNSQANRLPEKTQGNDAVIWAPVHSHNKVEVVDKTYQRTVEPIGGGDNLVNNSSKVKRAEIERYVPKPVAKELAQQGSHQPPSSSVDHVASDGAVGRDKASEGTESSGNPGFVVEPKHVDGKGRHPSGQGPWRQRVPSESSHAQGVQDSSSACSYKDIQPYSGTQQTVSDDSMLREQPNKSDELSAKGQQGGASDGWNSMDYPESNSSGAFNGVKDHFSAGRGKRHPFKGQKSSAINQTVDRNDSNARLFDSQPPQTNQTEKTVSSNENRVVADRSMSHWQPKSQGHLAHNQQGSKPYSGQNHVAKDSKDFDPAGGQNAAKDPRLASGEVLSVAGPQESKRDKRGAPFKGRPHSPSRGPAADVDTAPLGGTDVRNESRPGSGYRKNANYSTRFSRANVPRGDWSTTAQENRQHYPSAIRERQRQNSHYEYQAVGPFKNNDDPELQTEKQSEGPRFRERGQNHARRGRGNYGRRGGFQ